jgi:son of sevenless
MSFVPTLLLFLLFSVVVSRVHFKTMSSPDIYVQSIHPFSNSTIDTCLAFNTGKWIKVLNKHPSGWWDGEMSDDEGEIKRGWFPSNYVQELTARAEKQVPDIDDEIDDLEAPEVSFANKSL